MMPQGGAPVTPVDKQGNLIGSAASPSTVTARNTQTRLADTSAPPAFAIYALDGSANPALIAVETLAFPLTAGTNRSGTATTTSAQLAAANTSRRGLEVQNIGANNIGINEFGAAAAIGTAGTYTLAPGASVRIRTSNLVNVIAATASTAFTATEW